MESIWDNVAADYEAYSYHEKGDNYPANKFRARIILNFLSKLKKGEILDAGCGSGYMAREVIKRGWNCVGIDLSKKMLEFAKEQANKEGLKSDLRHCSVLDMDIFDDEEFDVVMMNGVLPYINKKDECKVYTQCNRILKNNGYLIIANYNLFFDFFTFDKYTIKMISELLLENTVNNKDIFDGYINKLKTKLSGPEDPKSERTMKSENPLIYKEKLKQYGFKEENQFFYNFHILPPSLTTKNDNLIREKLENKFYNTSQGLFFAKTFVSISKKI